jgi:hypothetical protein
MSPGSWGADRHVYSPGRVNREMGNTSDLDTRLSYCRRLITDGAARARASSELASGIESRLNSIACAVQSVGSSVKALNITIVKVSKDREK